MAEVKISDLPAATSVIGSDLIAGVESATTKKIKAEHILMTKSLTATRWEDLRVPVTSTKKGGVNDPDFEQVLTDGAGSQGVYAFAFDKTSEQELFFNVQVPHNWKIGTDLCAHVHWAPKDTDTGTIQWGLEYTLAERDGVFGASTIILSVATAAPGVALTHKELCTGDIDMSAVTTLSPMLMCRVFRNVAVDTYNNDAYLIEVDFHYQIDSLGSASETVK